MPLPELCFGVTRQTLHSQVCTKIPQHQGLSVLKSLRYWKQGNAGKRCDFYSVPQSIAAIFLQIFCDLCGKLGRRGGVETGRFPFWACPSFLSFTGLSRYFRDFPILSGIVPFGPFPLSRLVHFTEGTYEEQSRKGLQHNPDLSRKKWETSWFGSPPV